MMSTEYAPRRSELKESIEFATPKDAKHSVKENKFGDEVPMLPPHLMGMYFLNVKRIEGFSKKIGKRQRNTRPN